MLFLGRRYVSYLANFALSQERCAKKRKLLHALGNELNANTGAQVWTACLLQMHADREYHGHAAVRKALILYAEQEAAPASTVSLEATLAAGKTQGDVFAETSRDGLCSCI